MTPQEIVKIHRGQVTTTSLDVAETFKKQHSHVLKTIEKLECSSGFLKLNFGLYHYSSGLRDDNRKYKAYEITRDGWTFLVMGFTGKKAAKFKEQYIKAFNAMEEVIQRQGNLAWQELRSQGKSVRYELTDTIGGFIEYATHQGSKRANYYYMLISKATNKALFLIEKKSPQNFRDLLSNMQLSFLQAAEYVAQNAIREGMNNEMFYKDIYVFARDKVTAFAESVGGKTPVPMQIKHEQVQQLSV